MRSSITRATVSVLAWAMASTALFGAPAVVTFTPAHQASLKFMRGVNLGNYLEAPPNTWGNIVYTSADFALIRSEGFDHVRVPIAWHYYTGPGPSFVLSNSIFAKVDFLVNSALNRGLGVIIDLHHFDAFTAAPTSNTNKFYAIWKQIASHYATFSSGLAFELLNEPRDAATTRTLNPIYAEAIRQIRLTNPDRTLFLGPGNFNSIDELPNLILPATDKNLIATVHCYDPYYFTHQGAEWALPDTATTNVVYPGPPPVPLAPHPSITHSWVHDWFRSYNSAPRVSNPSSAAAFRSKMQRAKTWSNSSGRPVHVGEFGCYDKADRVSRARFYREIREVMDQQGLGWAMWDWKAGFHYIKNGVPDPPEMRQALFPPVQLSSAGPGQVSFESALGKTFVIERLLSFTPPIAWEAIATQTLTSPKFLFQDPGLLSGDGGFYRAQWRK